MPLLWRQDGAALLGCRFPPQGRGARRAPLREQQEQEQTVSASPATRARRLTRAPRARACARARSLTVVIVVMLGAQERDASSQRRAVTGGVR